MLDHLQTFNGGYAAMVTDDSNDTPIALYCIVTSVSPGFVAIATSDIQASDGNSDNSTHNTAHMIHHIILTHPPIFLSCVMLKTELSVVVMVISA